MRFAEGDNMNAVCRIASIGLCVCASGAAIASAETSAPPGTNPTEQQLLDEVRALRSEVGDLRTQLKAQQATSQPARAGATSAAADEHLTPSDLLRDLDRRQSMDLPGINAGWDPAKGFVIQSDDKSFLFHPWAFVQVRDATNYRQGGRAGGGDSTDTGLELPRAKIIFDGNIFTPDFTYQFIWATNTEAAAAPTGGNLFLQEAWGRYHIPGSPFALRAGNIRDPFDHEQIVFATKSLTPERSIVNNVMANVDGIVKGVTISYGFDAPSPVRFEAGYTGGMRNSDTSFINYPTNPASWGAAGRVDFKLFGRWLDYTQFTAMGDKEPLLVAGLGADYTEAGSTRQFSHVADVQFDLPDSLSVYAAYLGRYTTNNSGPPGTNGAQTTPGVYPDTYDSTLRVQAGYLIAHHLEPFARYEYLHFANIELAKGSAHDTIQDMTIGFNYYFVGHRAKISAAASYLPEGSPLANTQSDLLANRKNEVIIQAQFQLMI
jgi:hypothetical protein